MLGGGQMKFDRNLQKWTFEGDRGGKLCYNATTNNANGGCESGE